MYSLKLELKLNNQEKSKLAGCAGFARFVYNFGLSMLTGSWDFEGIKAGDSRRLTAIEKVFTADEHYRGYRFNYSSSCYTESFGGSGWMSEKWPVKPITVNLALYK